MNEIERPKYFDPSQIPQQGVYQAGGTIRQSPATWQQTPMQERVASKPLPSDEILKHLAGQIAQLQHIETRLRALNARLIGPPQEINGTRDSECGQAGGGFIAETARALAEQTRLIQNIVDQISVIEQVI